MPLNTKVVRQYLKGFDFKSLFIEELGWNKIAPSPTPIEADGYEYTLTPISEMGGMVVFRCSPASNGRIPDYATRRKIDKGVTKLYYEHIIIYCDADETTQVWQWVKREKGQPAVSREHRFFKSQSGEALIQKLNGLVFCLGDLDEEGNVPITRVLEPVRAAFDVERVTRRFYDRFKTELTKFQGFIKGIEDKANTEWYASLMLNRLMFVYFIQKKGFLDNDRDYLRNHLVLIQRQQGKNKFITFYRHFLLRLFHEGLGAKTRNAELDALLGKIPYLNGGLFEVHDLEKDYPDIQIPDKAFEAIFDFFDQYQWHLDERPLRDDREINPDVLGYIFEKYINQKQMGAYYTKEDITEYISKNTVLPFLFDAARKKCAIAFEGENSVWRLLQDDPDRYIYDAVKAGVDLPLPGEIAAGLDDVSRRTEWNKSAPSEYALPTEIWREVVARRERHDEVRGKLQQGEVKTIDDLITYNLDIRQFAQDVIANAEGSELIKAIWHTIAGRVPEKSNETHQSPMTILDPTCGSGAFLFAALNILEPLYEACLDRMEVFVQEAELAGDKTRHPEFRSILARMNDTQKHPNRRYFILKSIILGNLFGVDIMEEAVEICKLRLFLKLVSQVDFDSGKPNYGLEPLPDIDFNIRAGNTLVGFATFDEAEKAVNASLLADADSMNKIRQSAEDVERLWTLFHQQQVSEGGEVRSEDKQKLRHRLSALSDELSRYLAKQYVIDAERNKPKYDAWLETHQPFHWFVEFYGIMRDGGFDVVIGNPPYVEYSKVTDDYTVRDYATLACGNLYAFVVERTTVLTKQALGRSGMIIPHSAICTDRMAPLQKVFCETAHTLYFSSYDIRPAKLFDGVDQRLAIYLIKHGNSTDVAVFSSTYHRWHGEFRPYLLDSLHYISVSGLKFPNSVPKMDSTIETALWDGLSARPKSAMDFVGYRTPNVVYYHNAPRYWNRAMSFAPYFWNERDGEQLSTQVKTIYLKQKLDSEAMVALINSSLFYWWFVVLSDCRHLNMREIENFPLGLSKMEEGVKRELSALTEDLMADLSRHAKRKQCYYKATGQVAYDEYYPKHSKPIIDKIDAVLQKHYGFTDEELDFIINYDIKYRMGLAGGGDEDEG